MSTLSVNYSGSSATVVFSLNIIYPGSCDIGGGNVNLGLSKASFAFGDGSSTFTTFGSPSSTTNFTIAHQYAFPNVCAPLVYTVGVCLGNYTTTVEDLPMYCLKDYVLTIPHPSSNISISTTTSNCNTIIFTATNGSLMQNAQWIFGDGSAGPISGNTSQAQEMHTYTTSGTYTAYFTAAGVAPCTFSAPVTVASYPEADFTYTVNEACDASAGIGLTILNYSSTIVSYAWQFNGSNVPFTSQGATYQGLSAGINTISLVVNHGSCLTVVTKTVQIGGTTGFAISSINSCNQFTFTTSPAIQNAQWAFGDGLNSPVISGLSSTIAHTYPGPGTYIVSLSGVGLSPCNVQTTIAVSEFVNADFTYTIQNVCNPASGITLRIPNYDPQQFSYQWQINYVNTPASGQTGLYTQHLQAGANVIKLTITNSSGCSFAVSKIIQISAPSGNFSVFSPSVCVGDQLSVHNVASGGSTYSFFISPPSGPPAATLTGMNPAFTFTSAGVYGITLSVTSVFASQTCTSGSTQNITAYGLPDGSFTVTPVSCNNSVSLTLNNPGTTFSSYTISYGDLTQHTGANTMNTAHLTHTYVTTATYTSFPLKVTLKHGPCISEHEYNVTINKTASLVVNAPSAYICQGSSAVINALVISSSSALAPFTYSWSGPNGYTSSNQNISVTQAGAYNLTVTSGGICSMTLTGSKTMSLAIRPTGTASAIQHLSCLSSAGGSVAIAIPDSLQHQGFTINGTVISANPSANSTQTYAVTNLVEGMNYITITNDFYSECSGVVTVNITKDEPSILVTPTNPNDCSGGGSAVATTQSVGTLTWHNHANPTAAITTTSGAGGINVNSLAAGSYFVKNTYGSCTTTANFVISQPVIKVSKVSGAGACPGGTTPVTLTAQFTPSTIAGTFNFTLYALPSGTIVSGSDEYNLAAGSYSVKAEEHGCIAGLSFKIDELTPITVAFNNKKPTCKTTGVITAFASGGDGNYSYQWFWNGTTHTNTTKALSITSLSVPVHVSVTVTDASGCTASQPSVPIVVTPTSVVTLSNCAGIGNTNATHVTDCHISACVQGGTPGYTFEWYKLVTVTYPIQWQFKYNSSNVFVAAYGSTEYTVAVPTNSSSLNLNLNSDSLLTASYPFWDFTGMAPVPILNSTGQALSLTTSTDPAHYYKVIEQIKAPSTESLITAYSGGSGATASTENFTTGDYNLHVTDAENCKYIFSIGTLTFEPTSIFSITFSYVWGMGPQLLPAEPVDADLHENMIEAAAEMLAQQEKCMQQAAKQLSKSLKQNCNDLDNFSDELNISYESTEYHHTLYYYDRAGRLTKTVPPQGVHYFDAALLRANRKNSALNTWPTETHSLTTTYQYNSFGQLISQHTPDGGRTNFIYDSKNRLRFSQNSKQFNTNPQTYSYTKYDHLGRIIEVGESKVAGLDFTNLGASGNVTGADNVLFPLPATAGDNRQITRTVYSVPSSVTYYGKMQRFTQNRVSYTFLDEDPALTGDEHYTYYSYDPHGNVEWLVQDDVGGMGKNYIAYEYDLVSGKVLKVSYNEQRADRFFHRYEYDSENRLTATETSRNGILWDRDAEYSYYAHGPLKRTVLGEDKVQGQDYIYTIHGWMKAINSPGLSPATDPGSDNTTGNSTLGRTAEDRFGMVLNYYDGDYSSNTSNFLATNASYSLAAYNGTAGAAASLYNGNISGWIQSQMDPNTKSVETPRADMFRYDMLNRIKQSISREETTGGWTDVAGGSSSSYSTSYTYDGNGNILTLQRRDQGGAMMDDLAYSYDYQSGTSGLFRNRLAGVVDAATYSATGMADLQNSHVYVYDSIGNLIKETGDEVLNLGAGYDTYACTTEIDWTVYGKIKEINKTIDVSGTDLHEKIVFYYDAAGNRTRKDYYIGSMTDQELKTTFYVRDAQGNTMAIYERQFDGADYKLELAAQPIYGSDRIGQNVNKVVLATASSLAGLTLPSNGVFTVSEYQNWITSTNKKEILPGVDNNLCKCNIIHLNYNSASSNYQKAQSEVELLGIAHNGVAVAEDLSQDLQFYVVVTEKYLGANDACLIFDKEGKLMKDSWQIDQVDARCKPVIVNIPGTSRYAVVTRRDDGQAVYHIVDMSDAGFGPVGNMGKLLSANNLLHSASSGTHGLHFTGYEDHINDKAIVYASRFTPDLMDPSKGSTEIIAYDFGSSTVTPIPSVMHGIYGCGSTEQGQLQISPDGTKLAWWQYDKYLAGFTYRTGDIYTLPLNAAKTGVTGAAAIQPISPAGSVENGVLEFMANSQELLYAQRGIYKEGQGSNPKHTRNVWRYNAINLSSITSINQDPLLSYLFGEIKRGVDGNFYIPHMGQPMDQIHSYSSSGFNSNVTTPPASSVFALASGLPTQVFKVFSNPTFGNEDYVRVVGNKSYELKDHLGNVRVVVSDTKMIEDHGTADQVDNADKVYPEVRSFNDYYAFGMMMPGRQYNSGDYRYGFNGKENDNEVKGTGNQQDYGMRIYDGRIAKFLSTDPLTKRYPFYSPYLFAGNKPIRYIDLDGLEEASKEQKAVALSMLTAFEADASSKCAFANINKSDLIADLRQAINSPAGISMSEDAAVREYFCALYNVAYNIVYHSPELYTSMVLGLYKDGRFGGKEAATTLKEAAAAGHSPSAFMLGNFLRGMYNFNEDYRSDKSSRATSSGTMREWLEMLNLKTSEFAYGYELMSDGINERDMLVLMKHVNQGKNAVMLVSFDQLNKGEGGKKQKTSGWPFGDHFITITGGFTISEENNTVTFDYYDQHGGLHKGVTFDKGTFMDMTNHVLLIEQKNNDSKEK